MFLFFILKQKYFIRNFLLTNVLECWLSHERNQLAVENGVVTGKDQSIIRLMKDYPIKCHMKYPVGKYGRRNQLTCTANKLRWK